MLPAGSGGLQVALYNTADGGADDIDFVISFVLQGLATAAGLAIAAGIVLAIWSIVVPVSRPGGGS